MRARSGRLVPLLCFTLAACGSESMDDDAGVLPMLDGDVVEVDGSVGGDPDGGTGGDPDSGTGDPDSGTGDPDSGTGDPDSGTGDPDSGTGDLDGGGSETDGAVVTPDGGETDGDVPRDGDVVEADAEPDGGACVPDVCAVGECGVNVRDDGCGTPLDCGICDVGGGCLDDDGCSTGLECLPQSTFGGDGGYCSGTCRFNTDCGLGAHCGLLNNGLNFFTQLGDCLDTCLLDTECRDGYSCRDVDGDMIRECWPIAESTTAEVGDTCDSRDDCAGGADGICFLESGGLYDDGFCTQACDDMSPCPAGTHCYADADLGFDYCVEDCLAGGGCARADLRCQNGDGDITEECLPAGTGTAAIGDSCDGVFDCTGGTSAQCLAGLGQFDFADGYCTTTGCVTDANCGAGADCIQITLTSGGTSTTEGYCFDNCTADVECNAGYACIDLDEDTAAGTTPIDGECFPAATGAGLPGDACDAISDCAGRENGLCRRILPDDWEGYCTIVNCTATAGCPLGSHCSIDVGETEGLCLADCDPTASPSDCRDGYACADTDDSDLLEECIPGGTGVGIVGSVCIDNRDCAGGASGRCLVPTPPTIFFGDYWGGHCTRDCDPMAIPAVDCPNPSFEECVGNLCHLGCTPPGGGPNPCRDDYSCVQYDAASGATACLPNLLPTAR